MNINLSVNKINNLIQLDNDSFDKTIKISIKGSKNCPLDWTIGKQTQLGLANFPSLIRHDIVHLYYTESANLVVLGHK